MSKHLLAALLAAGLAVMLGAPALRAQGPGCASCAPSGGACAGGSCHGPKVPCPPKFCHVFEGPPRIKFKHGCPRPVCDPCDLEHYGYYQTCWAPWPFPADYRHCPAPHSGLVLPPPAAPPYAPRLTRPAPADGRRGDPRDYNAEPMPKGGPGEPLPPPRKFDDKPEDRHSVRLLRAN